MIYEIKQTEDERKKLGTLEKRGQEKKEEDNVKKKRRVHETD